MCKSLRSCACRHREKNFANGWCSRHSNGNKVSWSTEICGNFRQRSWDMAVNYYVSCTPIHLGWQHLITGQLLIWTWFSQVDQHLQQSIYRSTASPLAVPRTGSQRAWVKWSTLRCFLMDLRQLNLYGFDLLQSQKAVLISLGLLEFNLDFLFIPVQISNQSKNLLTRIMKSYTVLKDYRI